MRASLRAFTLVELAIALVIIGLLVGGVLAGQSLIEASRRRAILRELESYKVAVRTFQVKYNAIPGDMKNATQFWGTSCPFTTSHPSPVGPTCDGDGNGVYHNLGISHESFNFWHHLQNAGYTKPLTYGGPAAWEATIARTMEISGTTYHPTVPVAAIPGTVWWLTVSGYPHWPGTVNYNTYSIASPYYIEGYYGHSLSLGCPTYGGCNNGESGSPIQPLDAYDIDTKIDDGLAGKGMVVIAKSLHHLALPSCSINPDGSQTIPSTSASMSNVIYNTRATGPTYPCELIFKHIF